MAIPASIRNKNPGAQWPGKSSRAFGSGAHEQLKDGQNNKIAKFETSVKGAAALFHLLDRVYTGQTFSDAFALWSGNNHVNAYLSSIEKHTRFSRHDFLEKSLLEDPEQAIELGMAMARHEAGRVYPMSKDEWRRAHELFLEVRDGKTKIKKSKPVPMTAALELARSHIGEREIAGPEHNDFILGCFAEVGRPEIRNDETAWCAAFLGSVLKRSDYAFLPNELGARRYMNYGIPIEEPEEGAVCVEWREHPSSWKGHVSIVESWTANTVTMIGGNQSDSVSRRTVPRTGSKSRVLGYRRPISALTPMGEVVASDSVKYKAVGLLTTLSLMFSGAMETAGNILAVGASIAQQVWEEGPFMSNLVSTKVQAAKSLTATAGLPWPAYLGLAIVVGVLGYNLYETVVRKRNRQDSQTSAEQAPKGAAG